MSGMLAKLMEFVRRWPYSVVCALLTFVLGAGAVYLHLEIRNLETSLRNLVEYHIVLTQLGILTVNGHIGDHGRAGYDTLLFIQYEGRFLLLFVECLKVAFNSGPVN